MPTGGIGEALAAWAGSAAGSATLTAAGTAVAGAATSALLAPKPPPPPQMPTFKPPDGSLAAGAIGAKGRAAGGFASTNLTGPQGLTDPATTAPKVLLGS